jgi:hypothetical protein
MSPRFRILSLFPLTVRSAMPSERRSLDHPGRHFNRAGG